MNEHSSRSHAIFMVTVECSEPGLDGQNHIRWQLTFAFCMERMDTALCKLMYI